MDKTHIKKLKKLQTIRKQLEAYQGKLQTADVKKKPKIEAKMMALVNKSVDVIYSVE